MNLTQTFQATRKQTESLCEPLTPEDMTVQSCDEVSPPKWHLAHTSWFFETFILKKHLKGYQPFSRRSSIFSSTHTTSKWVNSGESGREEFSPRPTVDEVLTYRTQVNQACESLIGKSEEIDLLFRIGIHHEQQHQELLLMDIKNIFAI